MSAGKLILIDGMGLLYRSFFAIKELSTSTGIATNAVFGFVRTLDRIKDKWDPTHWLVVLDGGLPESRLSLLEDYKAQRKPMPDLLRSQVPLVEEYLDAARILRLRVDAQEADDVIASVAEEAADKSFEVLIASSDKDLYQLVGNGVCIISTTGDYGEMGPREIEEKTGVPPARIVDWLALTGDAVDNIPGIPGVGPKTAAKLLLEFGSLDGIWNNIENVHSERLRNLLEEHKDTVERNVKMVKLDSNIDCGIQLDETRVRQPVHEKLLSFAERLEFESMARDLRERDLFD